LIFSFSDFTLDDRTYELHKAGRPVALERRVFDVIAYLVRNRARVVPRAEIFRSVWSGRIVTNASLSIVITAARRVLGDDPTKPTFIATQHGRGYRFVAEVVEQAPSGTISESVRPGDRDVGLFVGRETELASLAASLAAARDGRLQLLSLAGEAGIGKTRVVEHFTEELTRNGQIVLAARSPEEPGAPPFWPWIQILRGYLDSIPPIDLSAFLAGLEDIAHLVPEVRPKFHSSPPPLVDPLQARFRLFDAIATCLERAAQRTPLAVVLEDIHRADEASLLLLAYITTAIPTSPLLVVTTYRDTHRNSSFARATANLLRNPAARSLHITGLPGHDAAALLESLAKRKLDPAVIDILYEKSGGNPFFLSQLARQITNFRIDRAASTLPADLADAVAMQIDS
jgi:DNA-binding winged helix-turn-helix (wHTH) protein